jgi:hypothetical protein
MRTPRPRPRALIWAGLTLAGGMLWGSNASASSTGAFLYTIPNGNVFTCLACHTDMLGPTLTTFGTDILGVMRRAGLGAGVRQGFGQRRSDQRAGAGRSLLLLGRGHGRASDGGHQQPHRSAQQVGRSEHASVRGASVRQRRRLRGRRQRRRPVGLGHRVGRDGACRWAPSPSSRLMVRTARAVDPTKAWVKLCGVVPVSSSPTSGPCCSS